MVVRFGMESEKEWVREGGGVWKKKVSDIDALLSAIVMGGLRAESSSNGKGKRVLATKCYPVAVDQWRSN